MPEALTRNAKLWCDSGLLSILQGPHLREVAMRNKLELTIFRLFAPIFFAAFLWFLAIPELLAQSANPYSLLRKPAVSKTQIAFSYGGDLWVVARGCAEAKRLTRGGAIEIGRVISP